MQITQLSPSCRHVLLVPVGGLHAQLLLNTPELLLDTLQRGILGRRLSEQDVDNLASYPAPVLTAGRLTTYELLYRGTGRKCHER
ncbi:hypothetical protein AR457_10125 [Streptomyces agglomeratus]|nr:hypothetical protein BGK70_26530 [Streptomyces agglomeratus]OEJ44406.1 hypothetical protein AR457_10125 [Streptomyces agglomeratus]